MQRLQQFTCQRLRAKSPRYVPSASNSQEAARSDCRFRSPRLDATEQTMSDRSDSHFIQRPSSTHICHSNLLRADVRHRLPKKKPATADRVDQLAAYSRHSPGIPFRTRVPRSWKRRPDPDTRSLTVLETSVSLAAANAATRAPMWTAMPATSSVNATRLRRDW